MNGKALFKADTAASSQEWVGCSVLAALCETAEMTNNEARLILLVYVHEKTTRDVSDLLYLHRGSFWRIHRSAGRKVMRRWPDIELLVEQRQDRSEAEMRAIIWAQRNSAGSSRTPLYMQNSPGEYRMVSAPTMVIPADLRRLGREELALESVRRIVKEAETLAAA